MAEHYAISPDVLRREVFWLEPVVESLFLACAGRTEPLFVAVVGAPASSKAIDAQFLQVALTDLGLNVLSLALDDFNLSGQARELLGRQVHPLFQLRGAVGTHRTAELLRLLGRVKAWRAGDVLQVPVFDLAADTPAPMSHWRIVDQRPDVVIVRGWCLGTIVEAPEALKEPLNALESAEDPRSIWRRAMNENLRSSYMPLSAMFDRWLFRQAPDFESISRWYLAEHERIADAGPAGQPRPAGDTAERFLMAAERVIRAQLSWMPHNVNYLLTLNNDKIITSFSRKGD